MRKFIVPVLLLLLAGVLYFFFQNVNYRTYIVEGKILGFSDNDETVFINHEEIPGYMVAMSMPFNVKNPKELEHFNAGDAVRFKFFVSPETSWIEDLEHIPDSLLTLVATPSRFGKVLDAESGPALVPGEAMPEFSMIDQYGNPFSKETMLGKWSVVTFIYTTCPVPDFCPLMSRNMDQMSSMLTEDELEKVHLISISFDANDTPDVLLKYAAEHDQRGNRWYVGGNQDEIARLTGAFGIFTMPAAGEIIHNLQTAIISPDGNLAALYPGNRWTVEEFMQDLRKRMN